MSSITLEFAALVGLGFLVGSYGTLIGAGGGFLLVPLLLIFFPHDTPAHVTAMSLTVVFFNAYGGTWAYARMGRINYRAGIPFAIAGIPGAVLGARLVLLLPRGLFDVAFGVLLAGLGIYLAIRPVRGASPTGHASFTVAGLDPRQSLIGAIGSAYLGLFASLMGIGGGILHVPFLVRVLRFPPHVATATSHFVLAIVALAAVLTHFASGELDTSLAPTTFLALGVMMGAPAGAALSPLVSGRLLIRLLAVAICLVAARLLWQALA